MLIAAKLYVHVSLNYHYTGNIMSSWMVSTRVIFMIIVSTKSHVHSHRTTYIYIEFRYNALDWEIAVGMKLY